MFYIFSNIYIVKLKYDVMAFEEALSNNLINSQKEKTFIDKLLSKDEVKRIQELIKKNGLSREELLELLYLISANEAKLVNYSQWDRYVILKYYCWLREFIKITELLYDYQDRLEKNTKFKITTNSKRQLHNISKLFEHNAKFLIDLYLNIARTSLSVGAVAFKEISQNKFELNYPHVDRIYSPMQTEKKGFLSGLLGGK